MAPWTIGRLEWNNEKEKLFFSLCKQTCLTWPFSYQEPKKRAECRQDWHQTGKKVVITIYAKCPNPTQTTIQANRVFLDINVVFGDGLMFIEKFELEGVRMIWHNNSVPWLVCTVSHEGDDSSKETQIRCSAKIESNPWTKSHSSNCLI